MNLWHWSWKIISVCDNLGSYLHFTEVQLRLRAGFSRLVAFHFSDLSNQLSEHKVQLVLPLSVPPSTYHVAFNYPTGTCSCLSFPLAPVAQEQKVYLDL